MFPKGPRFVAPNIPEVPGPNSYNLQESLDTYKRGAFLEKTDRFGKDKISDVPGPGAYDVNGKPLPKSTAQPTSGINEKYAALQRKVDELERVHNEGKKAQHAEAERVKQELARAQKMNTEQAERIDKQRKHAELLDARINELKKSAATDQSEVKELRVKLRMSEHERTQLAGKQGDASEAKKALHALEARRKEEVWEKDKLIAESDKAATLERKKREATETRLHMAHEELQQSQVSTRNLQSNLLEAQTNNDELRSSLEAVEEEYAHKEQDLVEQLEQYRVLLRKVAEEYSLLASMSIPIKTYAQLKTDYTTAQFRALRLERKLANSEGQVVELAHLIRQTKDDNKFLSRQLSEAESMIDFYANIVRQDSPVQHAHEEAKLQQMFHTLETVESEIRKQVDQAHTWLYASSCQYYQLASQELLTTYLTGHQAFLRQKAMTDSYRSEASSAIATRDEMASQITDLRTVAETARTDLSNATNAVSELTANNEQIRRELSELQETTRLELIKHATSLKKERDAAQRLNATLQNSRAAESSLRAEMEQLTTELTDAERYQEAYNSLSDEVQSLLDRNAVAEDEAERLSKFNAEILGHNNPAQKIMYLERIRTELAETKHKLVVSIRNHEELRARNEELLEELDAYKAVTLPLESKIRTNITRISRPALANLSQSLNLDSNRAGGRREDNLKDYLPPLDSIAGNMTLEELEDVP